LVATFIGWVIGVVAAIGLSYLIVNPFYPKETNLLLGLCMGAGVAVAQKLVLQPFVPLSWRWVWGAAAGIGAPFAAAVLIGELWPEPSEAPDIWLVLAAIAGGALAGALQAPGLRPHTALPQAWILASLISWGLAWFTSAVLGEAGFLLGGIVLGASSGAGFHWLLRRPPES
jgi:hypothetical protein